MTAPTRTRLIQATVKSLADMAHSSSHVERAEVIVDAILDELMNPGEVVFAVTREAWLEEKSPEYVFRVTIGAVREGK